MQVIFVSCLLAGLICRASAGVFITNPVANTKLNGGQSTMITWKDDLSPPKLSDVGLCEVGLYAGSIQQQTELQPIAAAIDVSKQSTLNFTIDPTIGQNSDHYFIRITSINLKDTKNPQFPYESFSAVFSLANMTGHFTATVQAQIAAGANNASSSAPAATSAAPATTSGLAKVSTTSSPSTAALSASASAAAPTHSSAALVTQCSANLLGALGAVAALVGLIV